MSTERTGTTTPDALLVIVLERLHDLGELRATDLRALLGEHPPALGCYRERSDSPDEIVVGVAARLERGHLDVLLRAAVGFADDHILGHVDQPPREVAGIGRS